MKVSALAFANAAGFSGAILWFACALVAVVSPDLYQVAAKLLAFGDSVGHLSLGLEGIIPGGLLFAIVSWVSGYMFGWSLNLFANKR